MGNSAYFVKSTPPRAFSILHLILGMYVTDILQMCMKEFNPKKIFLTNLQHFACLTNLQYLKFHSTDSAYVVKSTPPRAFNVSFKYIAEMIQTYCRCA